MSDNHAELYDEPHEKCPKCGGEDIANDDGPTDGLLHVRCYDCGHYWAEPCEDIDD